MILLAAAWAQSIRMITFTRMFYGMIGSVIGAVYS